jgi:DUF1680 family protein
METRKPIFIVDTSRSPYAKLRPVPVENVHLEDSFWAPRQRILREVTIPTQYQMLEETSRLFNFQRAAGKKKGNFMGLVFNDSDVYKWIEAVAYSLASAYNEKLYALAKQAIDDIMAAQDRDGYLDSYFMFKQKKERWSNLKDKHELYCAGHLTQAAIAHYRATGERLLLDVACRFADHIASIFSPKGRVGTPGHPEIEMALVELSRATGKKNYLQLAQFFIDERGKGHIGSGVYYIDHKPFRGLDEIVGHAVRSVYLNCGVADIYLETGEQALWDALIRLWHSMTEHKMYVTGGVGSRHEGEAFGENYELPNSRAYAETCAALANVMWNWRMLLISGEGRFADVMELALYNGVLSGISLNGKEYFYVNPLADRGKQRRQRWFECACCPPNIARLLASLSGYFYSTSSEGIWVHLYAQNTANLNVMGNPVTVIQHTNYPWSGDVEVILQPRKETTFSLFLRIPGWCRKAEVFINGEAIKEPIQPGRYLEICRLWKLGDRLNLYFNMPIERIVSHPYVMENTDRTALKRGPIIYCVEQADNPDCDVWSLTLPSDSPLEEKWIPNLLNGVIVIRGEALAVDVEESKDHLYQPPTNPTPKGRRVQFIAIPYYAWANRKSGPMIVWIRSPVYSLNFSRSNKSK